MSGSNRLAEALSPYLLQHSNNPVDWYPWGEEAFERARREDRPIFLSIGYATCHWCHVMEHESFEDPDVASLLNAHFVSIKVDREERPDIDNVYMSVCQMLTGHGGWPLTIVMTPERRPFFAATYIPRTTRHGRPGMLELLPRIAAVWREQRDEVMRSAAHLTQTLERAAGFTAEAGDLGEDTLAQAYEELRRRYDPDYGGFGSAPKFPTPHNLLFLLRFWRRTGNEDALEMVTHTLDRMRAGGIFDQIGGGFHRYATDVHWHLPHFEKMLYDQALLVAAYTEAYQATGRANFADTAREVVAYVLRDLGAPDGGFYSAEDADSEGREGKFYLWTVEELEALLEPDDAALAVRAFGMREEGNFRDEATHQQTGENILFAAVSLGELARDFGADPDGIARRLGAIRESLFTHRAQRVRPLLDDKILADWNGLFIAALAVCARAFDAPAYLARAQRAADFVLSAMRDDDGGLLHRYRRGQAGIPAMAGDYAALVWAMIELYESSFDARYLKEAIGLSDSMRNLFFDAEHGGFYQAASTVEDLIVRQKEVYDGAMPSANALQAWNLIRLARLTGRVAYESAAEEVFAYAAPFVAQQPSAHTAMMLALELAVSPSAEVVIAGDPSDEATRALLAVVRGGYRPNLAVLQHTGSDDGILAEIAPFVASQTTLDGRPAAYVCRDFACEMPTTDPVDLRRRLGDRALSRS